MDVIELDNTGEDRTEQREETERAEREDKETSIIENDAKTDADNIQTLISSETSTQSETRADNYLNNFDFKDVARSLANKQQNKEVRKEGAIQILRMITDENLGDYGVSSRELLDGILEPKFSEKDKLTGLKFKGEDVKLMAKGKISKSATVQNREILRR